MVAGAALLAGLPTLVPAAAQVVGLESARGSRGDEAAVLLDRARASADVRHSGVAETRGSLGLPDLPRLGGVAGLLGGTTRTRVWWASSQAWRVDTLSPTGEQGVYGVGDDVVVWDYEREQLTRVEGVVGARLPRADDLLPPQAARRLVSGVGEHDRLERLADRRVAGRAAAGLRIVPGDDRSTISRIDLWLDDGTGLPLELRLVGIDGTDALVSRYLDVELGAPPGAVVEPPAAPGAARTTTSTPDLASAVDLESLWDLPGRLAGLPASRTPLGGAASYGDGLARFVVLPLPHGLAHEVFDRARDTGALELDPSRGEAVLVGTPLLNAVVARGADRNHAYVVAGLVTPELLADAVDELLANPPPRRVG